MKPSGASPGSEANTLSKIIIHFNAGQLQAPKQHATVIVDATHHA